MNPVQLALRVLRGDSRSRLSAVLTALGVAVGTALVVLLSSLPNAVDARGERSQWQYAEHAAPTGTSLSSADFVRGEQITRLDVSGDPRVPADAPRLPAPGQVLLSPRLAELTRTLPPGDLADRFPGEVVGTIGPEYLRYPEQLVAVVAHPPGALEATAADHEGGWAAAQAGTQDFLLKFLAWVGIALLAAPSLVLVASASRLTAARRERRLAALRLAGATPGQVVATVAAETAFAAVAGTAAGLLLGWPLRMLVMHVPWGGGTWLASDFTPSSATVLGVAAGIPALVVLAAVLGLRRVVRAPVGAAMEHSKKAPKVWRLLAIAAAAAFFVVGLAFAQKTGNIAVLLASLVVIVLSASVAGPWLTAVLGTLFSKLWRRPSTLLAGRRLRNDPKAAYRSASGVVLAVFVGSMALTLLPGFESQAGGGRSFKDSVLYMNVPDAQAAEQQRLITEQLARAGTDATVATAGRVVVKTPEDSYSGLVIGCAEAAEVSRMAVGACTGPPSVRADPALNLQASELRVVPTGGYGVSNGQEGGVPVPPGTPVRPLGGQDPDLIDSVLVDPSLVPGVLTTGETTVAVAPRGDADREEVRTAMALAAPGSLVQSRELVLAEEQTVLGDLRRITAIGLVIASVLAGCSAAITAASSVVDRRRTFGALIAAGTPRRVLARALRTEAALPALVATLGAGAGGVGVGYGLLSLFEIDGALSPWMFAPVALGVLVAVLAASASGPMLRRGASEPFADE
ncbi:ABC transporter permease [Saccharopolyspora erythraea]|uniref:FtsX-like permease family protein n=1 Tax=Saccharopolyspora erythraea TaxID=1836 RepID=UPI001BA4F105|nr:FtsX-like permease family protein [Saccharopolyspora erythraea]QUH05558.1 ABC transporter permease [Saccharopolyspora erythraea]